MQHILWIYFEGGWKVNTDMNNNVVYGSGMTTLDKTCATLNPNSPACLSIHQPASQFTSLPLTTITWHHRGQANTIPLE
jgi:hypothetical protein